MRVRSNCLNKKVSNTEKKKKSKKIKQRFSPKKNFFLSRERPMVLSAPINHNGAFYVQDYKSQFVEIQLSYVQDSLGVPQKSYNNQVIYCVIDN